MADDPKPLMRAQTPEESVMIGIELAGSANIHLARAGRAVQFAAPAIQSWMSKEIQRGQHIGDVLSTFNGVSAQIVATQIYRCGEPEHQDDIANKIADDFRSKMLSALRSYRKQNA